MHKILQFVEFLSHVIWGLPMLLLLLGTHLYFTFRLGFIQKWLPKGIYFSFFPTNSASKNVSDFQESNKGISPYAALATALAATIGTGNIIGVSTAIAIGGPGAVFWCWITGFFGIATCYSECLLSMLYRTRNLQGQYIGGPMYVLKNGLHKNGLSILFAVAAILASFGMGSSVQSHSIRSAITEYINLSPHIIGIITALLAGFALLGGVRQISKICTFFVPLMSIFYLTGCIWLLFINRSFLSEALNVILRSAFSSHALAGGFAGTAVMLGIRTGISRGLFTNEAGLGSIPMTAAASRTDSAVIQSLISMTGPFWDTVVICGITGLVIVSGILKNPQMYQNIPPDRLCFTAFLQLPFGGAQILSLSLILFAFATILGWCYYGECGIRFLSGEKGTKVYQVLYLFFVYLGAVVPLDLVWEISDLLNALMMLPNLLCLWLLREKIIKETQELPSQLSRVSYSSRK